ncbi:MAG: phage holin family protein [Acidimicrobiales bacterium]
MSTLDEERRPTETEAKAPDRSLGELVSQLGDDLSNLLTTQVEIAKAELKQEAATAAKGAGMLAGAGVVGHLALLMLSAALAWGLAVPLNAWAGFLIVGLLWAAVAAVLALQSKKQLGQASGPEKTVAEIQADKALAQSITSN